MPDRIREINNRFIDKVGIETNGNSYAKSQIIVLDNKKEPYDIGIERADKFLLQKTTEANNAIEATEDAYNDRITRGCRSDLFWRVVGINTAIKFYNTPQGITSCIYENYTLTCDILNGYGYASVGNEAPPNDSTVGYNPNLLYVVNQNTNPIINGGFTTYPLDSKIGLSPPTEAGESYHTWKVDDEPYAEDLVDPIMSTGIGTIGLASNILTFDALTSVDSDKSALAGIKTGALITCDRFGIWFDERSRIVAYGNTVIGIGTAGINGDGQAKRTWVQTEDFAMREVKVPEDDGTFTNFFVLQGPDDINYDKFALKRTGELTDELAPEIPTRVCPMTPSLVGKGVKITYDNNSDPATCKEWNKFLEGFPDPADPVTIIDADSAEVEYNIVTAPKVGPGKTWYRDGFTLRPILPNGNPASFGDTIIVRDVGNVCPLGAPLPEPDPVLYENLPSCSDLDNEITDKEDERDEIEDQLYDDLENSNSDVAKLYRLTNALRAERNELNLRIWAYRVQMGRSENNVDAWDKRLEIINDPDFYEILQNPLDELERFNFNEKKKRPQS